MIGTYHSEVILSKQMVGQLSQLIASEKRIDNFGIIPPEYGDRNSSVINFLYRTTTEDQDLGLVEECDLQKKIAALLGVKIIILRSFHQMIDTMARIPEIEPFCTDQIQSVILLEALKPDISLQKQLNDENLEEKPSTQRTQQPVNTVTSTLFNSGPKNPEKQDKALLELKSKLKSLDLSR